MGREGQVGVLARWSRRGAGLAGKVSLVVLYVLLFVGVAPGWSQEDNSFPLRPDVRQRLQTLQESWIEWLSAVQEGDSERSERQVQRLLFGTGVLGMERLPELSVAASVQAERFAREGQLDSAVLALEAAERLDPGTPEAAFARSTVENSRGGKLKAIPWSARGYWRLLTRQLYRYVFVGDAMLWLIAVLSFCVAAIVSGQWATRGVLLFRDLVRFFDRSVPRVVSYVLTILLLLWPALLPSGLLWLALYWSVLVWGYAGRWERLAIVAGWVFLGLAPLLVSEQIRRISLDTTAEVRAMRNIADGRLVGSIFEDLAPLQERLPASIAVRHFLADLHLSLQQWELAREGYREVVAKEPGNASALADLGACYFYEGNLGSAISNLERATDADPRLAQAHFNLSRALSEEYRFEESERALRSASALDAEGVGEWIREADRSKVVMAGGGFAREGEIRQQLTQQWRANQANSNMFSLWRRMVSLPLVLIFCIPAIALFFLSRKGGNRSRRVDSAWGPEPLESLRLILLPGLGEAEDGRWGMAILALLVPTVLITAPIWSRMAYGIPWSLLPPTLGLSLLPVLGLVGFFVLRSLKIARRSRSS